jgi:hypothetical protein
MKNFKDVVIVDENGNVDEKAMKKERIKESLHKAWEETKKTASNVWTWVKDNKEDLAFIVPITLASATGLKKLKGSPRDDNRYRIDHTYYDPVTGAHWQLRKPLNNRERSELMARRRNGEYTEDILYDMGRLK